MSEVTPVRILLADDHPVVRQGMRALLAAESDLLVVAEAGDGAATLAAVEREQPDVVVLDLTMPGLHGVDVIVRLQATRPQVRVLVLSMHDGDESVRAAVRAGACGYLVKGADLGDLVVAVHTVAAGGAFFSPTAARVLLGAVRSRPTARDALTERECDVLTRVVAGATSGEIARSLGIGTKTVEAHRARIMDKLGLHDVPSLVRWAIRAGLVPLEP